MASVRKTNEKVSLTKWQIFAASLSCPLNSTVTFLMNFSTRNRGTKNHRFLFRVYEDAGSQEDKWRFRWTQQMADLEIKILLDCSLIGPCNPTYTVFLYCITVYTVLLYAPCDDICDFSKFWFFASWNFFGGIFLFARNQEIKTKKVVTKSRMSIPKAFRHL